MWVSMAGCENRSKVSREDIVRGMGKRHSGPDGLKDGARRVLVLESRDSGCLVMTFFDSVEEMEAHQTRLGDGARAGAAPQYAAHGPRSELHRARDERPRGVTRTARLAAARSSPVTRPAPRAWRPGARPRAAHPSR